MRSAVRNFGDRFISSQVGLVYYSGHVIKSKGRTYFIPVNTDIKRDDEIAYQGLNVSLIFEKMATASKGVNVLIVDACRNNPFSRSLRSTSKGLLAMVAANNPIRTAKKCASDSHMAKEMMNISFNTCVKINAEFNKTHRCFGSVKHGKQIYIGNFLDGKENGWGILRSEDGNLLVGIFNNGSSGAQFHGLQYGTGGSVKAVNSDAGKPDGNQRGGLAGSIF